MFRTCQIRVKTSDKSISFGYTYNLRDIIRSTCKIKYVSILKAIDILIHLVYGHRIVPRKAVSSTSPVRSYEIICGERRHRSGHKSRD